MEDEEDLTNITLARTKGEKNLHETAKVIVSKTTDNRDKEAGI